MKKFKRAIAALLVFLMVMQPAAFAASVTDFLDFPQDWSKEAMTAAVENGLYIGNENKLIQPGKSLTRAELAAFVTRAFGATQKADISMLTDVSPDDWFYEEVAKAYRMGALTGTSDTTFSPNAYITREQVFLAIARILCISGTDESVLDRFTDASDISTWAKNGIIGLVENGYVSGYPNGSFRPKDNISRAELAQVFHNIFKTYIDYAGYYSGNVVARDGSIMVRVPGVHLENATVNGDVVIADGVADGDFNITTVTVNGRVLARGGEGWVTFKDVTMNGSVVVYDNNGTVNFRNYRTDAPFKNLEELTPATFLTKPATGTTGGGTSSTSATYLTVRFYEEDGSLWTTQKVRRGKYAEEPSDAPEKEGYTFLYWSTEKKTTGVERPEFDFENTAIRKVTNLYPVYAKNPIVTTYDKDGNVIGTLEVVYNTAVSADELEYPSVTGYTFAHWSEDENGETAFDFDSKLTKDIDLYAVYSINTYTVTFYNGEETFRTEKVNYNGKVTEPSDPTMDGRTFKYWTTEPDGDEPFDFNTAITSNLSLYAKYDINYYTVIFENEDGSEYAKYTDVAYGTAIEAPSADPETSDDTKHFAYWVIKGTNVQPAFPYTVSEDVTFAPVFTDKAVFTVTLKIADKEDRTLKIIDGHALTDLPELTAPTDFDGKRYTFEGWFTEENGGGTQINATYVPTDDMILYAYLKDVYYSVTFENGETETFENKLYNDTITVPEFVGTVPAGQHFKQWKSEDGTITVKPGDEYTVTADITFVPEFEDDAAPVVTYTVKFTDGETPSFTKEANEKITVPEFVGTAPEGQHFKQWKSEDGTVTVKPGDEYTVTADITFNAEFEANPTEKLKVNFYTEPGTLDTTVEVEYNTLIDTAEIPTLDSEDGYVLDENVSGIYANAPYKRDHSVEWSWWTVSGNEWVEYDPTKPVTEDLDVYRNSKNLKLSVVMPKKIYAKGEVPLSMIYNSSVRAMDTLKDALYVNSPAVHSAMDSMEAKLLGKLEGRVIDNATNKNILNIHRHVKLVDVLGEKNIRTIIGKVVDDSVDRSEAEDYITDYLLGYEGKTTDEKTLVVDEIAKAMKHILAGSNADAFRNAVDLIFEPTVGSCIVGNTVDKDDLGLFFTSSWASERAAFANELYKYMDSDELMALSGALGQKTADERTKEVEAFIQELCNNDTAAVTKDNLFLYEPIYDMLKTHGWDFFEAKLPEKVKEILPVSKLKELYERHYTPYLNAMKDAMDGAENGTVGSIETGITIELNPVSDLMEPMFDFIKDVKARAEAKADASEREKLEKFYPYYKNNPFIKEYESFLTVDKWLNGSANDYTETLSGYSLKNFSDYYDILYALTAISDDAMQWFYVEENVPTTDRSTVLDAAGDYLLDAANIINNHVVDFAVNGIPTTLKEFCESIETDPELLAYLKKFGVDAYLTKLEDNATAGKVYATAEEKVYARFGARIDALLDKYASSKLNRTYTDEDYEKIKDLLYGLFTENEADIYTVDTLFDEYLNKYFDKFMVNENSASFEKGEEGDENHIKLVIEREMFYKVDEVLTSAD